MSNFKKLSEAMQFSPEKMKKNGIFETDRFLLRHLLLRAGPGAKPAHSWRTKIKSTMCSKAKACLPSADEERELGAGEIALAPAGQNHGVANRSQAKLVTLVFVTPKPHH